MRIESGTVSLEGMEFYAYHGYYEEEKKLGTKYSVDIHMNLDLGLAGEEDDLEQTVDYVHIYQQIQKVMSETSSLLESLASRICQGVLDEHGSVQKVTALVTKHHPPVGGICKSAKVAITAHR